MSFAYALKVLCDVTYYFAIASIIGVAAGQTGMVPMTPLILTLCAFGYHYLSTKTKKWYKYLPVLGVPLIFLFTGSKADAVLSVPAAVYACWYMWKRPYTPGHATALSNFFMCLKILPFPVVLAFLVGNKAGVRDVVIPYFFMFLVLSVMLLRMLRHDAATMAQTRFKVLNLSGIAAVCAAGWLLSSGWMLWFFRLVGTGIAQYILKPVFSLLLYIVSGIMWVVMAIFSGFEFDMEGLDLSELAQNMDFGSDIRQLVEQDGGKALTEGVWWDYFVIALAVVALIAAAFVIFRLLSRSSKHEDTNTFADEREIVAEGAGENRDMRENREKVRNYYRKFLKLCGQRGFEVTEYQDSKDIEMGTVYLFGTPARSELRDVYVRARYSSAEVTDFDVEDAKDCYKRLKKSGS